MPFLIEILQIKVSHQWYKLPLVDGGYRLQTASCGKRPATATTSLGCKQTKGLGVFYVLKYDARLFLKKCSHGTKYVNNVAATVKAKTPPPPTTTTKTGEITSLTCS